jgi:signal transduction histidine kinase
MASPDMVPSIHTSQDRTYNIAIVDDDKADFILISRLLEYSERGNFRLTHIASFNEAVRRLESESYDVALIDHFLDGKLGVDLIRQLGGRIAPCALIMLTGGGAVKLDLAALDAGAADYLDKNDLSSQMLARSVIYAHARFDIEQQFRKSQAQLRRARDAAAAANIAKSEFVARMSDQLRAPITSIIGFAEIIGNRGPGEKESEKYVDFAHEIRNSGTLLLDMINDIRDISKIDKGELRLQPERLDLSQVIVETMSGFQDSCTEQGIVLVYDKPDEPVEVLADPHAVRKIMKILLSNAVKFTPADGKITVSSQVSQDSVTLVVADTGIGIEESHIAGVLAPLEPLVRGNVSLQQGTGLSLAICKSLAEMQGGALRIESIEGSGTKVLVTIPADSGRN